MENENRFTDYYHQNYQVILLSLEYILEKMKKKDFRPQHFFHFFILFI